MLFNFYNLVCLAMSWLIFLGNLGKILFLDTHAKILQVRTNFDIFMVSNISRSWQDLTTFSMFLIKVYQVSDNWVSSSKLARLEVIFKPIILVYQSDFNTLSKVTLRLSAKFLICFCRLCPLSANIPSTSLSNQIY